MGLKWGLQEEIAIKLGIWLKLALGLGLGRD